ncbi:PEP-CTERM sorting domain-containing protein [bacterium]|nr:PEP-CTERM sorting domain-containing protein [bacterium]
MNKFLVSGTAALVGLTSATSASAAIVWGNSTGVLEARNFWYQNGGVQRSLSILGFNEEQEVLLNRDVSTQMLNEWDDLDNLIPIAAGKKVSSHMLYFTSPSSSLGRITASATVVFENPILGFVGDFRLFRPDNDLFAPGANWNGPGVISSLEEQQSWTPLDAVTLLDDRTIQLEFTTQSAIDPLRVITLAQSTESIPEPLTVLGTGVGLGFGVFFKRKLSKR